MLQVVQQLSQIQEVSDPAAALADLVQQARDAQAGPTSRAPNAMPAFDAASMPPSYPLNSQHGSQAGKFAACNHSLMQ